MNQGGNVNKGWLSCLNLGLFHTLGTWVTLTTAFCGIISSPKPPRERLIPFIRGVHLTAQGTTANICFGFAFPAAQLSLSGR